MDLIESQSIDGQSEFLPYTSVVELHIDKEEDIDK